MNMGECLGINNVLKSVRTSDRGAMRVSHGENSAVFVSVNERLHRGVGKYDLLLMNGDVEHVSELLGSGGFSSASSVCDKGYWGAPSFIGLIVKRIQRVVRGGNYGTAAEKNAIYVEGERGSRIWRGCGVLSEEIASRVQC